MFECSLCSSARIGSSSVERFATQRPRTLAMSSALTLRSLKDFLKTKFVTVSDQWLTALLEANSGLTNDNVYEHWLNSEISSAISATDGPPLPVGCNQIKIDEQLKKPLKTTLTGKYALQINSIEDISCPKVQPNADLLEDVSESEGSGDETQTHTKLFNKRRKTEPKKKVVKKGPRMLSMVLTDGITQCKAIEYQPIACLTVDTPVGSKLLISGPIDVYTAVMFLTSANVKTLGGSIPIEANAQPANSRPLRTIFPQTTG